MHEGHRQRLVGKVEDKSTLYEHELMEILLFNVFPRRNVNGTAHALINKFGSCDGVLKAGCEELLEVDGVGINVAEYIRVLGKCLERASNCVTFSLLKSTTDFRDFLAVRARSGCERLELCLVDKEGRIRNICTVKAEEEEGINLTESQVVKYLSVYAAYGVFAAYYRTNCASAPTERDEEAVKKIADGCKLCGVRFFDYCIASPNGDCVSLYASDKLEKLAGHSVVRG